MHRVFRCGSADELHTGARATSLAIPNVKHDTRHRGGLFVASLGRYVAVEEHDACPHSHRGDGGPKRIRVIPVSAIAAVSRDEIVPRFWLQLRCDCGYIR